MYPVGHIEGSSGTAPAQEEYEATSESYDLAKMPFIGSFPSVVDHLTNYLPLLPERDDF